MFFGTDSFDVANDTFVRPMPPTNISLLDMNCFLRPCFESCFKCRASHFDL